MMRQLATVRNRRSAAASPAPTIIPNYAQIRHITDIWSSFRRHRLIAFVTVLVIMGGVITAVKIIPPYYRATASIMIQARTVETVKVDPVLSNLPGDSDTIASELQVLQSRDLLARLVTILHLDIDPEFDPNYPHLWQRVGRSSIDGMALQLPAFIIHRANELIERPPIVGEQRINAVIDEVSRHFEIAPAGRSRVINITFTSKQRGLPSTVANTLAELYIGNQFESKQRAAEEANRWIMENLAGLRQRTTDAAKQVATFRAANGIIEGKDSTTLVGQELSEISTQLTAAKAQRLALAAKLNSMAAVTADPKANSQVLASPIIQQLRQQQAALAAANASLDDTLGGAHPRLQANNAELAKLEGRIATETQRIVMSVRSDYLAARNNEAGLQAQFEAVKQQMERLNAASVHLKELQQEEQANRALYDSFLQRSKETGRDQTYQTSEGVVISHAAPPNSAYFPNSKVILAIAAVASLMMALVIILGLEAGDGGFRNQAQLEKALGIPVVGITPDFQREERAQGMPDPLSLMGSAITDIFMRTCLGNKPRCILIASALPREGKTLTGLFLARVAAMNGMRVLLIDADLRRSGLATKLPSAVRGLSDLLVGTAAFEDVVHQDAASIIHIIGCGAPVTNPAGLLISEQMQALLKRAATLYDLVLIDTSAIMAGPDAMVLSHLAHETLMFVRWARTPRQVVGAAIQRLIDGGANVSGAIMTRVDLKRIASYSMTDGCSYSKAIRRYYYPASRT